MTTTHTPDVHAFEHHWQDEADAAYLYDILASLETNPHNKDIYSRLADVERKHVQIWEKLLVEHGHPPKPFKPSGRTKLLARLGKMFGPGFLLPMLLKEEGREVKAYMDMHRSTPHGAAGGAEALQLARESAEHATELATIKSGNGDAPSHETANASNYAAIAEPWHSKESGGLLRNVVYGFNDGLTANFGLVAGVVGAATANQQHMIIVAGVAGLIADALSMGSSGYLAAKSQQEVYQHEIEMERDEIALMPEVERDELALIYEAKGMDRESAHKLATQVMANPERMLQEQVQEELKIGDPDMSPMREAWITGLATAFGAIIPVFPFLITSGMTAVIMSFIFSMASHFLVGAARSVFTGRSVFRSGMDMFVVGLGVAIVGYYVGEWVAKLL